MANQVRRHQRQATIRQTNGKQVAVSGTIVNPDGPDTTQANGNVTHQQASRSTAHGIHQLVNAQPQQAPQQTRVPAAQKASLLAKKSPTWSQINNTYAWNDQNSAVFHTPAPPQQQLAATFQNLQQIDAHIRAARQISARHPEELQEEVGAQLAQIAETYTKLTPAGIRNNTQKRLQIISQMGEGDLRVALSHTQTLLAQLDKLNETVAENQSLVEEQEHEILENGTLNGRPRRRRRGRGAMGRGGMGMGMGGRGNQNQKPGGGMEIIMDMVKRIFTGR